MADLISAIAAVALATNLHSAAPRPADGATGFVVGPLTPGDSSEQAYQRLLELDDAVQEELDRWIREADEMGPTADNAVLQRRIDERIEHVDRAYRDFLGRHPDHARARIAYGSFLNDTGQESPARDQWEKALELDPKNPAIYNNLAGIYGHRGPVTNAFSYYEKAIELNPTEPVYYQNLATTVFLFRKDVMEYYGLADDQRVFDKALTLYRKATTLDPNNFIIATDLAQTYYGVKPPRHDEAIEAWRRAYDLAADGLEREGIRTHLARVMVQAGRFNEARTNLALVTNGNYAVVKERILKTLENRERQPPGETPDANTNEAAVTVSPTPVPSPPRP